MDIAVNLVEIYLRLTGYLTLSEFEVQAQRPDGAFESITDVDIMAIRFPGPVYAGDPHGAGDARLLLIEDPALMLADDQIDIIVGEVKQGEAEFNPGIKRHQVLHSVLRRVAWLFDSPIEGVVADLGAKRVCVVGARGGGTVRVRLVAFGRSKTNDLNTMSHTHVVETVMRFFTDMEDAFRPIQFSNPAAAMLSLLRKSGFEVIKDD